MSQRLPYMGRYVYMYFLFQSVDVNEEIDGRPPIVYAADYGQTDVIEYLISRGANVDVSKMISFVGLHSMTNLFYVLVKR